MSADSDADDLSEDEAEDEGEDISPMDFNIFVLSLNTSALMHLGDAPAEDDGPPLNLPMARQTIDMLAMLEIKTKGNLTGQEEQLLHQVLFDLRMRYTKKAADAGP